MLENYNLIYLIQSISLICISPLFLGILKKIKAFIRGYQGSPILQVYYDIFRLIKKGKVISKSSSFITKIGPIFSLSAAITTAFFIPVIYTNLNIQIGSLFVIIFLLSIIKFFNTLIGLDCASTFGGMGTSRELFISMLAEPILFLIIVFIYLQTNSLNIFKISNFNISHLHSVANIIAMISFFVLLLAENARMPVDNPETHLELTMVHEAMILDVSGSDLAFLELASCIKFTVYLTLLINLFAPIGVITTFTSIIALKAIEIFIVKMIILLTIIAVIETTIAKFRLFRVPELLASAFAMAILAITIQLF